MTTVAHQTPPQEAHSGGSPKMKVGGKYVSLTTYRRDGTPVATPVWFIEDDGRLFVITDAGSYKAKRIRRNPAVRVASCTARGAVRGEHYAGWAEFLPDSEHGRIDRLMAQKYRIDRILILPIYRLAMKLTGRGARQTDTSAYLAITPTSPAAAGTPPDFQTTAS
jgi:PPOX class probable F420-dependent enzyme